MAQQKRSTIAVDAAQVTAVGTGGDVRPRAVWVDGQRLDEPETREGQTGTVTVHDAAGLAVSIGGHGQDGATVRIGTALDAIEAGTIYRAEGSVEVTHGVEARIVDPPDRAAFATGSLTTTVWIERLVPAGSVDDLLRKGSAAPATSSGTVKATGKEEA